MEKIIADVAIIEGTMYREYIFDIEERCIYLWDWEPVYIMIRSGKKIKLY